MKIQVEWNDTHSWKVTKHLDRDGKVVALKFKGKMYYPYTDYSGRVCEQGNWYIGSDCCDNCELQKYCKGFNPINNACEQVNRLEISWHEYNEFWT